MNIVEMFIILSLSGLVIYSLKCTDSFMELLCRILGIFIGVYLALAIMLSIVTVFLSPYLLYLYITS